MSHFTMLVAGDVDYNMAPFHEFECDGHVDEFVKEIDTTEETYNKYHQRKQEYAEMLSKKESGEWDEEKFNEETKWKFKGDTFEEFLRYNISENIPIYNEGEEPDYEGKAKYNYAVRGTDEESYKVYNRTNPDSKWDWYVEGGRWNGLLRLKDTGEMVNTARKGDVDFEGMWNEEEEQARLRYRAVIDKLGGVPVLEHTWKEICEKVNNNEMTWDEARDIYDAQEWVVKFNEARKKDKEDAVFGWLDTPDKFACTEDEYVVNRSVHAITYGIVVDRKWCAKGEMGWWCCDSNVKEPISWDEEYKMILSQIPDNETITVVDCHI